jgi:aspartate aminotransferase
LFQILDRLSPDPILGLMAGFRADAFSQKVDLGVGVYRDEHGRTPVLEAVREAERWVLDTQDSKSYVAAPGREEYNRAVEALVLGSAHPALRAARVRTVQAPGGCGALRVGAELVRAAAPAATVHVSDPTWANHVPLLGSSGLTLARYPYYDAAGHRLRFEAMLDALAGARPGDLVLLHASCHNPCGADLSLDQWQVLAERLERSGLIPFIDIAYQGLGVDLDADAAGLRLVTGRVPEALVAVSGSKNLGLYRERLGALLVIGETPTRAEAAYSHMLQIARSIYSMPPDHGAAIAARIFAEPELRQRWTAELRGMQGRLAAMRTLLAAELRTATGTLDFDFIGAQPGMFSMLGVGPEVVGALRERHHIYMMQDSRFNVAGITRENAAQVARAIAAERTRQGG